MTALFRASRSGRTSLGTAAFCPADRDFGEKSSRKSGINNDAGRELVSAEGEKLIWPPVGKNNRKCMANSACLEIRVARARLVLLER